MRAKALFYSMLLSVVITLATMSVMRFDPTPPIDHGASSTVKRIQMLDGGSGVSPNMKRLLKAQVDVRNATERGEAPGR